MGVKIKAERKEILKKNNEKKDNAKSLELIV